MPDSISLHRMSDSITELTARIRAFVEARDWKQFHGPKEMATAISVEASELLQHFVWLDAAQADEKCAARRADIADEIADVGILLFEMADNLGFDLAELMRAKLERNESRYPVEKARGSNKKYNEFG